MPPKKAASELKPSSLEGDGIVIDSYQEDKEYPEGLKGLFKMVHKVGRLRIINFGGKIKSNKSEGHARTDAMARYEKELALQALIVAGISADVKRRTDRESSWVSKLEPAVFLRFDREEEERYEKRIHHHCFICRKYFPYGSRPPLSDKSTKIIQILESHVLPLGDEDKCQLCQTEHFNLPNFNSIQELKFPASVAGGARILDLTIGLHTYNLDEWPDDATKENDRVKLFDADLLGNISTIITPLFVEPGTGKHSGFLNFAFPFAIWEAKRPAGSSDHDGAVIHNAEKVQMLLKWQSDVWDRSGIPNQSWSPLVWVFVSVGAKWEVYGCHIRHDRPNATKRLYRFSKLWSGDSTVDDEALQLLYLVDIIALWAEHMYKPFAATCIARAKAEYYKAELPQLEHTLWASRLEVNYKNFSWLRRRKNLEDTRLSTIKVSPNAGASDKVQSRAESHHASSPEKLRSSGLVQNVIRLSIDPGEESYVIPEQDSYIWVLDHGCRTGDLLIVRVDVHGAVLHPLVIFDRPIPAWDSEYFRQICTEEGAKFPTSVTWDWMLNERKSSYVRRCIDRKPRHFLEPLSQFCAIIPLNSRKYDVQRCATSYSPFRKLETALGLPELIAEAEEANKRWCSCEQLWDKNGTLAMIECCNSKCATGWYHNRCVGVEDDYLDDDYPHRDWICDDCVVKAPKGQIRKSDESEDSISSVDSEGSGESTGGEDAETLEEQMAMREASDLRIQRMRTLAKVWKTQQWPKKDKVLRLFHEVSCRINFEDNSYDTVKGIMRKETHETGCWAIMKDNPTRMKRIRPVAEKKAMKHRKSDCGIARSADDTQIHHPLSSLLSPHRKVVVRSKT